MRCSPNDTYKSRPSGGSSSLAAVVLGLALLVPAGSGASDDAVLHGFAQAGYASRVTGLRPAGGGDFILGEERVQLTVAASVPDGRGSFSAKSDLVHDAVTSESSVEVREAYLDLGFGPLGARVGRQIVTWGTGDLLFVNDLFPKDWVALFAGRPLEYLKLGSDAVKFDWYLEGIGFETVVSPFFGPTACHPR